MNRKNNKRNELSGSVWGFFVDSSRVRNPYDSIVPLVTKRLLVGIFLAYGYHYEIVFMQTTVRRRDTPNKKKKRMDIIFCRLFFFFKHFAYMFCRHMCIRALQGNIFARGIKLKITRALWNFYLYIIHKKPSFFKQ